MTDIGLEAIFVKETGTWETCVPDMQPGGSDPIAYMAWMVRQKIKDGAAERSIETLRGMQQQVWNLG